MWLSDKPLIASIGIPSESGQVRSGPGGKMTSSRRYPPNTHPADDWQGMAFTDHPPASATIDVASLVLPPIQLEQHQPQSEDQPATNSGDTIKTPARKRAKKPPPISTKHADGHQEDSDLTPTEELESGSPPSKKRKTTPKKKAKQPIVFDIPPIPEKEKKMTTFKGRLGYACLNTVLRNKRPAREAVFCSRTLRIDTIKSKGTDYMKELGKQNMRVSSRAPLRIHFLTDKKKIMPQDLATLIQWNEDKCVQIPNELHCADSSANPVYVE